MSPTEVADATRKSRVTVYKLGTEDRDMNEDDDIRTIECPKCLGTGKNRFGGPCRACKATGELEQVGFFLPAALLAPWRLVRRMRGVDPDTGLRRHED